jgi:hypothetical protein
VTQVKAAGSEGDWFKRHVKILTGRSHSPYLKRITRSLRIVEGRGRGAWDSPRDVLLGIPHQLNINTGDRYINTGDRYINTGDRSPVASPKFAAHRE